MNQVDLQVAKIHAVHLKRITAFDTFEKSTNVFLKYRKSDVDSIGLDLGKASFMYTGTEGKLAEQRIYMAYKKIVGKAIIEAKKLTKIIESGKASNEKLLEAMLQKTTSGFHM